MRILTDNQFVHKILDPRENSCYNDKKEEKFLYFYIVCAKSTEVMMKKSTKRKVRFLTFHIFVALLMLTMPIVGMTLIEWFLYALGVASIAFGVISFFPNFMVQIEVFEDIGLEIVRTNLFERLGLVLLNLLLGLFFIRLPELLSMPKILGFIVVIIFSIFLGIKIVDDNTRHSLADCIQTPSKFIPLVYMIAGAIFMLSDKWGGAGFWIAIAVMLPAVAFHVYYFITTYREAF